MDAYRNKSPLISETLEVQLKTLLSRLNSPVEMTCILDDGEKCIEMGTFVKHLCSLSDLLHCRFLSPGQEPDTDAAMNHALLPATGIAAPGQTPRMVFHGIPGGKEITAFASAILTAGGGMKPLDKPTLKDIGRIKKPMVIEVCVSLACQHCCQLVSSAHRIAWENPLVTAHMIDANLYPELVSRYSIQRVPLTVIDGENSFPGGKTMAELTTLLAKYR